MSDITKRPGKFKVSQEFIVRDADELLRVMARCVVIRAEVSLHERVFNYIAYSFDFDEVEEDAPIPSYEWVISRSGPAVVNVMARRLQP